MYNMAFAGFRHGHIMGLYNAAVSNSRINIAGSFEEHDETRKSMEENGIVFNYATYRELLEDKSIDAVAIGDYYGIRGQRVIEALKAGKHVICDKPLCTKLEEEEEIRRLAKEKNLQVFLMLDLRYYDVYNTAKKLIEEGTIGKVTNVFFQGQHPLMFSSRPSWYFEEGKHGGTINDIAIHGVDLVKYMTGLEVKKINSARTWNSFATEAPDFEDAGVFMCEMSNGASLLADVSYAAPDSQGYKIPSYWQFQVWGLSGMLNFGRNIGEIDLYLNGEAEGKKIQAEPVTNTLMDDFIDSIEGKCDGFLTTEEVLNSTKSTLEIQRAAL